MKLTLYIAGIVTIVKLTLCIAGIVNLTLCVAGIVKLTLCTTGIVKLTLCVAGIVNSMHRWYCEYICIAGTVM